MNNTIRLAGLLAALCALLAACGGPARPEEFAPEGGGFSVMAPYPLAERTQSSGAEAGGAEIHMFAGGQGDKAFIVGYSDYPADAIAGLEPEGLLDAGRDGAVSAQADGELVSEERIALDGHPGRELRIKAKSGDGQEISVRARLYLVENRLYQVMALTVPGKEGDADIAGFVESFKLTGK